jgi:hypothetical protein
MSTGLSRSPTWLLAFLDSRVPDRRRRREVEADFNPELVTWLDENRVRAESFSDDELDELFSLRGVGGPLTREGIEAFAAQIQSRRELLDMVTVVCGTEMAEPLRVIVRALYEAVQPYRR